MGVEGRARSLSRQNSDEDAVTVANPELRLRRSTGTSDGEHGKALAEVARSGGSADVNEGAGEGSGGHAAVQSWFQRLDDSFLSPLFRISTVERERLNSIVDSFHSDCTLPARSQHGCAGAASLLPPTVMPLQVHVRERRVCRCRDGGPTARARIVKRNIAHGNPRHSLELVVESCFTGSHAAALRPPHEAAATARACGDVMFGNMTLSSDRTGLIWQLSNSQMKFTAMEPESEASAT